MKKLSLLLIGLFLIPSLFLTSCDQGDEPGANLTPEFTLMKDYMVNNNLDIPQIITNTDGEKFVTAAPAEADLAAFLAKYYIIDIRNSTDYNTSHITGAKNVPLSNILTEGAAAGSKPVLVVCYTGQTACYATALMRLYGFSHTKALKWGMSGWNSATSSKWDAQIGKEPANGNTNWTNGGEPALLAFTDPAIAVLSQDGATILKRRVELVLADGFKTASGTDVLNTPSNYFINNFFSSTDYTGFGHINEAYRISPLSLADGSYKALDPGTNAKVVTYCYTGQTSAVVTACLRVLGYDAYSLSYGMNGLYNTNTAWTTNQWGVTGKPQELPFAAN